MLEEELLDLSKYGNPRVAQIGNGWYCGIEMFVTGKGIQFEIKSDYNCKSPLEAVRECKSRLTVALAQMSTIKGELVK